MNALFLWHVTLNTGHVCKSFRHEVSDEAVAYCRDLIESVLRDDLSRHPIRGFPQDSDGVSLYRMTATASARNLLATIWREEDRIVTLGIGTHSRGGASLWKLMVETARTPVAPTVMRCPPEPWVAARPEPGCVQCTREVLMMLGDLEKCLGHAWLESVEARGKTTTDGRT